MSKPKPCHRRDPERHGRRNRRPRRETVQGARGQAGHDAGVVDGEGTINQVTVTLKVTVPSVHLDAEIAALEGKLSKARPVKQGYRTDRLELAGERRLLPL